MEPPWASDGEDVKSLRKAGLRHHSPADLPRLIIIYISGLSSVAALPPRSAVQ